MRLFRYSIFLKKFKKNPLFDINFCIFQRIIYTFLAISFAAILQKMLYCFFGQNEVKQNESFRENIGRKIALALCFATCIPVISTVYAYEAQPGWHGEGAERYYVLETTRGTGHRMAEAGRRGHITSTRPAK